MGDVPGAAVEACGCLAGSGPAGLSGRRVGTRGHGGPSGLRSDAGQTVSRCRWHCGGVRRSRHPRRRLRWRRPPRRSPPARSVSRSWRGGPAGRSRPCRRACSAAACGRPAAWHHAVGRSGPGLEDDELVVAVVAGADARALRHGRSAPATFTSPCLEDGGLAGETAGHEVGHGEVDHGFGAGRECSCPGRRRGCGHGRRRQPAPGGRRGSGRRLDAVTAGLTLPWSSGAVEGHVNRRRDLGS